MDTNRPIVNFPYDAATIIGDAATIIGDAATIIGSNSDEETGLSQGVAKQDSSSAGNSLKRKAEELEWKIPEEPSPKRGKTVYGLYSTTTTTTTTTTTSFAMPQIQTWSPNDTFVTFVPSPQPPPNWEALSVQIMDAVKEFSDSLTYRVIDPVSHSRSLWKKLNNNSKGKNKPFPTPKLPNPGSSCFLGLSKNEWLNRNITSLYKLSEALSKEEFDGHFSGILADIQSMIPILRGQIGVETTQADTQGAKALVLPLRIYNTVLEQQNIPPVQWGMIENRCKLYIKRLGTVTNRSNHKVRKPSQSEWNCEIQRFNEIKNHHGS